MSLTINFALANTNVSNEILLDFVTNNDFPAEIYKLSPTNGKIVSASTDWKAIVETTADGLTILTSLWMFYSEYIKPNKNENNDSGVYISVQINNNVNNIWIGNEINSSEELIIKYNDSIKYEKDQTQQIKEVIDSNSWKKIK
jgi:hypothetical protein